MIFAIVENGITVNRIVAPDNFDGIPNIMPDYEGCNIGEPYAPPPTPEEQLRADVDFLMALGGVEQ